MPGFSVDAGSSEWQVVYEFCRYYGGIAPRFDRLGRLVLAPWEEGRRLVLGADAAVTSFRLREQRYGVLSEVLVRDRTTEEVQRVADEDFLRRGGRCRRVLTMPGKSSYQAMRYSGAYQLARAGKSCGRQSWSYRRPLPRGRGNWWSSTWPRGRDGASGGYGRAYAA